MAATRVTDRRARLAVTIAFGTQALPFASWTAHIPAVAADLGLDNAALGTALLGAPVGSVLSMPLTGRLLPRVGSPILVRIAIVGYLLACCGIGLAGGTVTLFLALALCGFFQGSLGVAMNTQGVTIERSMSRPIMSGFHGAWSIGALGGAMIGSAAVAAGVGLLPQLMIMAAVLLVLNAAVTRSLIDDRDAGPRTHQRRGRSWSPMILLLGGIATACMLCEGAAADWSAKYLRDSLHADPGVAGLAYAAYAAVMVVVRLSGGWVLSRRPVRTVLPVLALVATLGMTAALVIGTPAVAIIGFALLGAGVAAVVPAAFTAAGRLSASNAGTAIATVSALGWAGFMIGPPAIGHLAQATTLTIALAVIPILTAAVAAAIRFSPAFRGQ
ncbi:MFS transporter [Microlunatus elymi]|uniref:MFS transporter n=1 Tax=Microlunatus elymi TaxID=2596828 RepID=UPI001AEFDD82|nr:MFS transporter [Microlunatus elymi]